MAFDIHQHVFDANGEYLEDAAIAYRDALMSQFAESPEGKALLDAETPIGWADTLMDMSMSYLGVTPAEMTPQQHREVLFEIFPSKVSAEPGAGPEIIKELQGFWSFLRREYSLPNADAILKQLNDRAGKKLEKELQNPENFGIAKQIVMMGEQHGFDMSTQEGAQAWMETYNRELSEGKITPIKIPPHMQALADALDAEEAEEEEGPLSPEERELLRELSPQELMTLAAAPPEALDFLMSLPEETIEKLSTLSDDEAVELLNALAPPEVLNALAEADAPFQDDAPRGRSRGAGRKQSPPRQSPHGKKSPRKKK